MFSVGFCNKYSRSETKSLYSEHIISSNNGLNSDLCIRLIQGCILGRSHRPKKANFKVWNAFFAGELCCEEIENYQKLVKRWLPCSDLPFWWLLYANELFDHFIGKVAFSMGSKINKNAKLKINVVNLNHFSMSYPLVTSKILYHTDIVRH